MTARLRQAVLAATELEPVCAQIQDTFGLGEPYADPAVAAFGLRNAVFALRDTFLEVVSPIEPDAAAARWLQRRGVDCGYMAMFEVDELDAARRRAADRRLREVFAIELEDMAEVHLHPADVGGAIVSLSRPQPPGSWRWGGPGWPERSRPLELTGVTVALTDPGAVQARWSAALGAPAAELGIRFVASDTDAGIVEVTLAGAEERSLEVGGVVLRSERLVS